MQLLYWSNPSNVAWWDDKTLHCKNDKKNNLCENCVENEIQHDLQCQIYWVIQHQIETSGMRVHRTWRVKGSMTWHSWWGLASKEEGRWRRRPLLNTTQPGSNSSFRQYTKPLHKHKHNASISVFCTVVYMNTSFCCLNVEIFCSRPKLRPLDLMQNEFSSNKTLYYLQIDCWNSLHTFNPKFFPQSLCASSKLLWVWSTFIAKCFIYHMSLSLHHFLSASIPTQ